MTGCTGFIGSNLAKRLVGRGDSVFGFVRHTTNANLEQLGPIIDKIRFVEGDLTDYHSVVSAVEGANPDFVIHLGALTPVRLSYENPFAFLRVNFQGTCNMVHAILDIAPKARLIYSSTAEVYGWQRKVPIRETARLRPLSPYGVSKSAADEYVQMAGKAFGLKYTIYRCNNTYGRRRERGFLVEYIISSMLNGGPAYIGAPDHVRDYMFVDDHINAYVLGLEKEEAKGEVFNVSPGNPVTNRELGRKIAQAVSYRGQIVEGSYPPRYPYRPAKRDTEYIVLDSSRIRKKLGWRPSVTLEDGIKIVVNAWLEAKSQKICGPDGVI